MAWRKDQRAQSLQLFTERSKHLIWSPALLRLLLEELWIEDELVSLIGAPGRLSVSGTRKRSLLHWHSGTVGDRMT